MEIRDAMALLGRFASGTVIASANVVVTTGALLAGIGVLAWRGVTASHASK
jgi:hypothetical protein